MSDEQRVPVVPSLAYPTSWPRKATPSDLVPLWAGEFKSFDDWVNFATKRLTGCHHPYGHEVGAICVDSFGRRCTVGGDFMRARDEDAFPVRYFWECTTPAPEQSGWQPIETAPRDGRGIQVIDMTALAPETGQAWFRHGVWTAVPPGGEIAIAPEVYRSITWPTPTHWMPLPTPPSKGGEGV